MAIKVSKINETTRTITFRFLGDDVTVRYRLGRLNEDMADVARRHGDDRGAMARMVEHVVESWDVLDDEGERIAPTAELIERYHLPGPFLNAVFDAIREDADPSKLRRA